MPRLELNYSELGVAWQQAQLPTLPAIFTWRNHAQAPPDPAGALHEAHSQLRARGLIDARGEVSDELHKVLAFFAHAPFQLDLRFAPGPDREIRAGVTTRGDTGVLGVLDGDRIAFTTVRADAVVATLVKVLPEVRPAQGTAVSLPTADLDAAIAHSAEYHQSSDEAVLSKLTTCGVSFDDARLFVNLVGGKRLRYGNFGIAVRDASGKRHRSTHTVQAIDTRFGRAALYAREHYLIAAPANDALFVRVLTELRDAEQRRVSDDW